MLSKIAESDSGADLMSEKIEEYYWECLKELDNEDHDLDKNYNLILTKNFLFMVHRSAEAFSEDGMTVTANSMAFVGSLAVKREEDLELINKYTPIGILEKLCVSSSMAQLSKKRIWEGGYDQHGKTYPMNLLDFHINSQQGGKISAQGSDDVGSFTITG